MIKHIFALKATFPELFERVVKPIPGVPVFFEGERVSTTSLDGRDEFPIVLPAKIERMIGKNRLRFVPLFEELNRNRDPSKVRLRITGIRIKITKM